MAEPTIGSPAWWLAKMEKDLRARQASMALMDDYYSGNHPLPFITKAHDAKMRNEFRNLLNDARSNFMRLVIDATEERLRVDGFRLSAEKDEVADEDSWEIWQANNLDSESQTAFLEALIKGVSYLSVWAGEEHPTIAVEDASQTIVAYAPGSNYRRRVAAAKVWLDDLSSLLRANVYLPDGIYKFKAKPRGDNPVGSVPDEGARWVEMEGDFVANPLGIVSIIPLRNRPRLLREGESELADVYRTQNIINGQLFLRCLAGYFGAHRQRWAVGLTMMEDDSGKPVEPFNVAIDKLWHAEDQTVQFGEFSQTDLSGYIKAIEQDVLHIAVTSRTPRHYLIEQGQSPSGDAIRSAESGLVKKVERKQRSFGEGLEEAIRLARRFAGEQDAPPDSEIVWADPQTVTEAETTDAAIKQFQAGLISRATALRKLGYTQTEIRREMAEVQGEALLAAVLNPQPEDEAA